MVFTTLLLPPGDSLDEAQVVPVKEGEWPCSLRAGGEKSVNPWGASLTVPSEVCSKSLMPDVASHYFVIKNNDELVTKSDLSLNG